MAGSKVLLAKLQAALDERQDKGRLIEPPSPADFTERVDFGSNDTLSISNSGKLSQAFLLELQQHPNFTIGSTASRILEGSSQYMIDLEKHIAEIHRADTALLFNSGFEANVAIWSVIPQPGDLVLYDEYVHASIHDGMRKGRARTMPFLHSDCESLRKCLEHAKQEYPDILRGRQNVFIALESFYSMDGDGAPIEEIIKLAKEVLPKGNALCVMDEAHSNGLVGPAGAGFVSHYGLEKEFIVRLHTYGKAFGSSGAAVLASQTIKDTLINYSRNVIFTTAPSFLTLAAIKAGYNLIAGEEGDKRRQRLQDNTRYLYHQLTNHPKWTDCGRTGILSVNSGNGWRDGPFQSPVIPLVTKPGDGKLLADWLVKAGFWVNVVYYPVVPKDKERVRLSLHADNSFDQIRDVVNLIMEWVSQRQEDVNKKIWLVGSLE